MSEIINTKQIYTNEQKINLANDNISNKEQENLEKNARGYAIIIGLCTFIVILVLLISKHNTIKINGLTWSLMVFGIPCVIGFITNKISNYLLYKSLLQKKN